MMNTFNNIKSSPKAINTVSSINFISEQKYLYQKLYVDDTIG